MRSRRPLGVADAASVDPVNAIDATCFALHDSFSHLRPHACSTDMSFPIERDKWTEISTRLRLSTREAQIARLLLDERDEADIAATLSISPRTVHGHLERLYRKLHIHSRSQLLLRLFKAYLLSDRQGRTSELDRASWPTARKPRAVWPSCAVATSCRIVAPCQQNALASSSTR